PWVLPSSMPAGMLRVARTYPSYPPVPQCGGVVSGSNTPPTTAPAGLTNTATVPLDTSARQDVDATEYRTPPDIGCTLTRSIPRYVAVNDGNDAPSSAGSQRVQPSTTSNAATLSAAPLRRVSNSAVNAAAAWASVLVYLVTAMHRASAVALRLDSVSSSILIKSSRRSRHRW